MKRSTLIAAVDVIAFAGFLVLTSTGVLLHYMLPPGSGRWSTVWSLSRHSWGDVHYWVAVGFFAVLAGHLVLHWRYLAGLLKGRAREGSRLRVALGLTGLVVIVALAAGPLLTPVQTSTDQGGRHGAGAQRGAARTPTAPPSK